MGMDFVTSHGMTVQGADYAYIYGGLLSENDTLDSLYQTFNINHPENYTGHSLLSAMWLWYKEMEKQKHIMWTVLVLRSCQILYSRESRRQK